MPKSEQDSSPEAKTQPDPQPRSEIYLDVETLRLSHEVPGQWSNIKAFGLAVAVTWDAQLGFRSWFERDASALLAELGRHATVVTFNGERFDFEVLSAYGAVRNLYPKSLDVLVHLKTKLGFRVKLESLAQSTLGRSKTGSGIDSVGWWRNGEVQKVESYCREDVQILCDLVAYGRAKGHVLVDGKRVAVSWI